MWQLKTIVNQITRPYLLTYYPASPLDITIGRYIICQIETSLSWNLKSKQEENNYVVPFGRFVTFKVDQFDFLLSFKPSTSSSRLPVGARSENRCMSPSRG